MPYGKGYDQGMAPGVPTNQKRRPAQRVSYDNTKLKPRSKGGDGHLGTVLPRPNPR